MAISPGDQVCVNQAWIGHLSFRPRSGNCESKAEGRVFRYGCYVLGVIQDHGFCVEFDSPKAKWSTFREVLHQGKDRALILEKLQRWCIKDSEFEGGIRTLE